ADAERERADRIVLVSAYHRRPCLGADTLWCDRHVPSPRRVFSTGAGRTCHESQRRAVWRAATYCTDTRSGNEGLKCQACLLKLTSSSLAEELAVLQLLTT